MIIHNVHDKRHDWIGSWEAEPLVLTNLIPADAGRTVIYRDYGRAEAGTLSNWNDQRVWARFSKGDTAAASDPAALMLAVKSCDGPERT